MPFADHVNVALCNDRQYEPGLHVSLLTLLRAFDDERRTLRIFLFHEGFGEEDIERLEATLSGTGKRYVLVARECDTTLFRGLPRLHGNYLTYVRLLVAELVPEDRIVFLDSDVIVETNLAALFDSPLEGRALGVVANGEVRHANDQALLKSLGMAERAPYFNAAVLLIDSAAWRSRGYSEECLRFLRSHAGEKITVDQTALNYVLRNDFRRLDDKYNIAVYPTDPPLSIEGRDGIFHLCGSPKPWDMMGSALHGNYRLFEALCRQTALGGIDVRNRLGRRSLVRTALLARSYWKNLSGRLRRALRETSR